MVTHLPSSSAVEDELGPSASYLVRLGGVESQWGVFAPNPRSTSLKIEGRVTFEDGSTAVWHLPEGARIGGNLRYYRWRKWLERVRSDDFRSLWEPTCQWIASLYDELDSPVEQVQLVRLFHDNRLDRRAAALRRVRVPHLHARSRADDRHRPPLAMSPWDRFFFRPQSTVADDARARSAGAPPRRCGRSACCPTSTPSS